RRDREGLLLRRGIRRAGLILRRAVLVVVRVELHPLVALAVGLLRGVWRGEKEKQRGGSPRHCTPAGISASCADLTVVAPAVSVASVYASAGAPICTRAASSAARSSAM